ncbi:ulp1 protease family, C-terminal catalytic domain-containing protein [Tanacetum coccineum]
MSSRLSTEQEEIELGGFGRLPIVEDLKVIETKKNKTFKKKNLIENRSITEDVDATEDVLDKNEDFKSLDFEESNEDEIQNEAEHNKSKNIDNIGNLSLSTGQKTTVNASVESIVNAPVESIVNATVESTDNVVAVLPRICVQSKESDTLDVATKKEVEVKKAKVLKEKRTVKLSSNFYDRRINISEPLFEEEKKIVEYIWSNSCPEGDIVFASKGLELECLWFLSLYPEIKVDASVIDVWSDVLNHEENIEGMFSIPTHVTVGQKCNKNKVNERRRIFDDNVAMILENSMKKNFNHVDLVFFPCIKDSNHYYIICFDMKNAEIDIIDNINNDVEDISERYGAYAVALIDSFINYLERHNHPSIFAIVNVNPKQVPMKWNTRNKSVDSGVFVMRHMETYLGHEELGRRMQ